MLRYAAIFLVISIVAFIFGFLASVFAGGALWLAKAIFIISLFLFVLLFILDLYRRRYKKS